MLGSLPFWVLPLRYPSRSLQLLTKAVSVSPPTPDSTPPPKMVFLKYTSLLVASCTVVLALLPRQNSKFVPLVNKRYKYEDIPYRVDTDVGLPRGEQIGYNICNSTTEGPNSLCQTAIINSVQDFCIWAPPKPGEEVGSIEGEMVAWCTRGGHGTRVMPSGTITGVQWTTTPDYIQVVGFMDQTKINMVKGDSGGEMDPHGADLRGNPMGGLVYTNAWNGSYTQAVEWHNFNGADTFCFKACDPRTAPRDAKLCQHIYDTQGCGFNAPSNARPGVFESCLGDSQAPPGQGVAVPASSSCTTYASTVLYDAAPTTTGVVSGSSPALTTTSGSLPSSTSHITGTSLSSPAPTSGAPGLPSVYTGLCASIVGGVLAIFFL